MTLFGPPDVKNLKTRHDVSGLIKALNYKKVYNIRAEAAQALGELKDPLAVEPLIASLYDENESVRLVTVKALGEFKEPRVVEALGNLLKDRDTRMQIKAVELLGKFGGSRVAELLASAVLNQESDVAKKSVEILERIGGAQVVERLVIALKHRNSEVRLAAIRALGKSGDSKAVEPLLALLRDSPGRHPGYITREWEQEMYAVASAFEKIGDERVIGWLTRFASDYPWALYKVLQKSASKATEVDLREVAKLPDNCIVTKTHYEDGQSLLYDDTVDFSEIKQLVRQELIRRGPKSLAQEGGTQAINGLVATLKDAEDAVREVAVMELVKIGEAAVGPLVDALKEEAPYARQAAALALGQIGNPQAVVPLVKALRTETAEVRPVVVHALVKMGKVAIDPVVDILQDEHSGVRQVAAEVLDSLAWTPGNDKERVWHAIARRHWNKLPQFGSSAVSHLVALLHDRDSEVVKAAATALGQIGDQSAAAPLAAILTNCESDIRLRIAESLVRIGKAAVGPLVAVMKDPHAEVRELAAETLGTIGDEIALVSLIDTLEDKEVQVRKAAIKALGKIGNKQAVESLIKALEHEDWSMRERAAEALGQIADVRATEPLTSLIWHDKTVTRIAAVKALEKIGKAAINSLRAALEHNDSEVREAAASALDLLEWQPADDSERALLAIAKSDWGVLIGLGEAVVEPLIIRLTDDNIEVRKAAVKILGTLKDPRSIEPLIAALKDSDSLIRKEAAKALEAMGWQPGNNENRSAYQKAKS